MREKRERGSKSNLREGQFLGFGRFGSFERLDLDRD